MGILHEARPRVFPPFAAQGARAMSLPRQGEAAPPFGTPRTIHLGGYQDLAGAIR